MEVRQLPGSYLDEVSQMKTQLAYLLKSKLIVDSVECVNTLGQLSTRILVECLGKKLQHVPDDVKKMLVGGNGSFSGKRRNKKSTCGTYFELMRFHANPEFSEYLCTVEERVIGKFNHIPGFPKEPESLRKMFHDFVNTARVLRDAQSHIGLLKEGEKEEILQQIEENFGILEKCSFDSVTPLISAGIHILRHGIPYAVEDDLADEGDLEEKSPSTTSKGLDATQQKQTSDGHTWSKVFVSSLCKQDNLAASHPNAYTVVGLQKFKEGENFQYSFVIMKKRKATKWVMEDGPFGDFTVHVGASAMTLEAILEGKEHGGGENESSSSSQIDGT